VPGEWDGNGKAALLSSAADTPCGQTSSPSQTPGRVGWSCAALPVQKVSMADKPQPEQFMNQPSQQLS
jgi:hypothetical protein